MIWLKWAVECEGKNFWFGSFKIFWDAVFLRLNKLTRQKHFWQLWLSATFLAGYVPKVMSHSQKLIMFERNQRIVNISQQNNFILRLCSQNNQHFKSNFHQCPTIQPNFTGLMNKTVSRNISIRKSKLQTSLEVKLSIHSPIIQIFKQLRVGWCFQTISVNLQVKLFYFSLPNKTIVNKSTEIAFKSDNAIVIGCQRRVFRDVSFLPSFHLSPGWKVETAESRLHLNYWSVLAAVLQRSWFYICIPDVNQWNFGNRQRKYFSNNLTTAGFNKLAIWRL